MASDRKFFTELERKRLDHGPATSGYRERVEVRDEDGKLVALTYAEVPDEGELNKPPPRPGILYGDTKDSSPEAVAERAYIRQVSLKKHGYTSGGTIPARDPSMDCDPNSWMDDDGWSGRHG